MRVSPPSPRTLAVLLAAVAAALTVAIVRRPDTAPAGGTATEVKRALIRSSVVTPPLPQANAAAEGTSPASDEATATDGGAADEGAVGDREAPKAVEVQDEMQALLLRLEDDPNDQDALDRLTSLHLSSELRDEIFGAVSRLYHENPGSHVLAEALGVLCNQEERFEEAAEHLRRAADYTNRPMRVRTLLSFVELKSGDFAAARESAHETRLMLSGYLTGKRDRTLIKEELKDDYMIVPCYFEAIAAAKSDDLDGARRALATCGDGILSDAERQKLIEESDVESWRDRDLDDILD